MFIWTFFLFQYEEVLNTWTLEVFPSISDTPCIIITVFWNIRACSLAPLGFEFGRSYHPHLQAIIKSNKTYVLILYSYFCPGLQSGFFSSSFLSENLYSFRPSHPPAFDEEQKLWISSYSGLRIVHCTWHMHVCKVAAMNALTEYFNCNSCSEFVAYIYVFVCVLSSALRFLELKFQCVGCFEPQLTEMFN
jgi:hypothetical protein